MLTANRPEMARRAVECFRRQTYQNKSMLVYETGWTSHIAPGVGGGNIFHWTERSPLDKRTIGELRNTANGYSAETPQFVKSDIIVHFDDDDYSHPNRIAEQVAILQSSGADCVGYREMLFWREPRRPGEAWLYSNPDPTYALGTSLCYWRRAWQARPFEATSQGEDERFIRGLKCVGGRAFRFGPIPDCMSGDGPEGYPRMIARIHAGNTSTGYRPELMEREARRDGGAWRRAPEWNEYCADVMT